MVQPQVNEWHLPKFDNLYRSDGRNRRLIPGAKFHKMRAFSDRCPQNRFYFLWQKLQVVY